MRLGTLGLGLLGGGLATCGVVDSSSSNGFAEREIPFRELTTNGSVRPDEIGIYGNRLIRTVDRADFAAELTDSAIHDAILNLLSAEEIYLSGELMECSAVVFTNWMDRRNQRLDCIPLARPSMVSVSAPVPPTSPIPPFFDLNCGSLRALVEGGIAGAYEKAPPRSRLSGSALAHFQSLYNGAATILLGACMGKEPPPRDVVEAKAMK